MRSVFSIMLQPNVSWGIATDFVEIEMNLERICAHFTHFIWLSASFRQIESSIVILVLSFYCQVRGRHPSKKKQSATVKWFKNETCISIVDYMQWKWFPDISAPKRWLNGPFHVKTAHAKLVICWWQYIGQSIECKYNTFRYFSPFSFIDAVDFWLQSKNKRERERNADYGLSLIS